MTKDRLPKTDLIAALRDTRDAEKTVRMAFSGSFDKADLTEKENEIYNRVVALKVIVNNSNGRLKRNELLEEHCRIHRISTATAGRDWKIVATIEGEFRTAELELERAQLYKMAWESIDLAKNQKDSRALTAAIKVAKDVIGVDAIGSGSAAMVEKIEQHINIIVSDSKTERILEEMVRNDMSVMQWNMSLEDILKEEATPKFLDIEHEEIGIDPTHATEASD
jgi:hypothetical protein